MTRTKRVDICGDILEIRWDGNVWVSPHNGQQHAHARDAMRSEIRAYYLACGDDVEAEAIAEQIEDDLATMTDAD